MLKFFIILPFLLLFNNLRAQVKLTNKCIPQSNRSFIFNTIYDTNIVNKFQFDTIGTNIIWDFSKMTKIENLDTTHFTKPQQTPYYDSFPSSNLVSYFSNKFYGTQYTYYKYDASKIDMVGTYFLQFPITNKNTFNNYNPPLHKLQFPTESGSKIKYNYQVNSPIYVRPPWTAIDTSYIKSFYNYNSRFIASGTIKLPNGNYPTILEVLAINSTDSTYSPNSCTNCPWIPEVSGWGYLLRYNWYINETIEPVAIYSVNFSGNSISLCIDSFQKSNIEIIDDDLKINIYPNPASSKLFIENMDLKNCGYVITDVSGREIKKDNLQTEINIEDIQEGMYIISVYHQTELIGRKKFVKQ